MSAYHDELRHLERRLSRPYDEQVASHIVFANGSLLASYDRAFLGAALRAHLDAIDEAAYLADAAERHVEACAIEAIERYEQAPIEAPESD